MLRTSGRVKPQIWRVRKNDRPILELNFLHMLCKEFILNSLKANLDFLIFPGDIDRLWHGLPHNLRLSSDNRFNFDKTHSAPHCETQHKTGLKLRDTSLDN
jgi:hypothetical protein